MVSSRRISPAQAPRHSAVVSAVIGLALLASSGRAIAQQAQDSVETRVRMCPYYTCALRVESSFWRGVRVMQGIRTDTVPYGGLGGGLARAVRGVPFAEREAAMGRRRALTAVAWIVPSVLIGSSMIVAGAQDGGRDRRLINLGVLVSTVGGLIGGNFQRQSENHYSRAVWYYNRELAR
jgi:hypothetical protein